MSRKLRGRLMVATYTKDQWVLINKNFEKAELKLVSEFTKQHNKHTFLCLNPDCGLESSMIFSSVKANKSRCVHCSKKSRKYTKEDWIIINKNFEKAGLKLVSGFTGSDDKHKFLCLNPNCGLISSINFTSVKARKSGCQPCISYDKCTSYTRLSERTVTIRRQELRNRGIELLNDYITAITVYDWKCLNIDCGFEWKATFSSVYHGKTCCPKCKKPKKVKNVELL